MKVPLLDLAAQHRTIQNDVMEAVARVFEHQHFIMGAEVEQFETDFAAYYGVKHAIGCASGSDAVYLALLAIGLQPGAEVITTPYTFFATTSAITRLGARPVYLDISPDDFNFNVAALERAVTSRTAAILPVHLYGLCALMDPVMEVARKYNLPVIEDAAQAVGAEYKGRRAGTMGLAGCFSFFPTKNLGGAGDGGLIITNDDELAAKIRLLRMHGMEPKYYHKVVGINSRLDALQAAVLGVKLKYLDSWNEARRRNAARYDSLFTETRITEVAAPRTDSERRHIYHQYTIRCARRDELKDYLQRQGIGTEIYYPVPLHLQECFEFLGYQAGDLPETEKAARECLSLPIYAELTAEQQGYVVDHISRFYGGLDLD
ncbi:MAG: DegT/DnrJ/EryC1/StrS family aminotransferase [Blastocatellia bacterium]|nr:DegT/DnrJ/EryC1/StrS family aminotransferase [Blastocatellia bacterium]